MFLFCFPHEEYCGMLQEKKRKEIQGNFLALSYHFIEKLKIRHS